MPNKSIWLIWHISRCNCPTYQHASFCNRNVHMCAHFCYTMMHCGILVWCMVGFGRWIDCQWNNHEVYGVFLRYKTTTKRNKAETCACFVKCATCKNTVLKIHCQVASYWHAARVFGFVSWEEPSDDEQHDNMLLECTSARQNISNVNLAKKIYVATTQWTRPSVLE